MSEEFWWETYSKSTNVVPSLDTGVLNYKRNISNQSIFASKNFKDISSMLDKDELTIAALKAEGKSNLEVASKLGMDVKEVSNKVAFMTSMYKNIFGSQEKEPTYRTIKSKTGR